MDSVTSVLFNSSNDILNHPSILSDIFPPSPLNDMLKYPSVLEELQFSALSILNIPTISKDRDGSVFTDGFCSAYEQLMRTLDFPVVQPVITEEAT